jgi:hypothetical protein
LSAFGDYLLFHDGAVHVLPHAPDLKKPTELLSHPAVYRIIGSAGIEFGWLHLEGCDCPRCVAWRSAPAAWMRQDQAPARDRSTESRRRPTAANMGRGRCAFVEGRNRCAARRLKGESSRVRRLAMMAARPGAEQ